MLGRPLCQMALLFALGVAAKEVCLPCRVLFLLSAAFFSSVFFWFQKRKQKERVWYLLLPVWLGAGMLWCAYKTKPPVLPEDKSIQTFGGTIYERQEKEEKTVLFIRLHAGRNCIAYYEGKEPVFIGNSIQFTGTVSLFSEATNPGQFNAKSYYQSQKIDFSMFQITILQNDNKKDELKEWLFSFRSMLHEKLGQIGGSHASVLCAMLLGEKSQMDSEIKELYQKNGISHILVISGLHFSMLGMCLYELLRKAKASFLAAGSASVAVLFLYGCMTGFGTSAVRAFIMFAISVGASAAGRGYDLPSALGAAVLWILADNPYALFQPGFLLSVGAILGIILILPAVEKLLFMDCRQIKNELVKNKKIENESWKRAAKRACIRKIKATGILLLEGACSGISIQLATIPVLLCTFYECSPYSILLNCLVLPLLPVVVLGSLSALFAGFAWLPFAKALMLPSLWVLDFYEWLCRMAGKLPGSTVITGALKWHMVVLYYLALGIFCVFLRKKERQAICARVMTGMLFLVLACVLFFYKDRRGLLVTMLDVGQGQSVYIRNKTADILYDGGSTDVSQVGKYRIIPFLKASGVSRLELAVVSHMDADHYNGIIELLEDGSIPVDCLMLSKLDEPDESYLKLIKLAKQKGAEIKLLNAKDSFQIGELSFFVLHPSMHYKTNSINDTSLTMRMEYEEMSMLFTGDIEEKGEMQVLKEELAKPVDFLQVAHHGSKSSSTEAFLEAVSPQIAWISCGKKNRYGHPHEEILERLKGFGIQTFRTDECGAITIERKAQKIKMRCFLE